MEYFKTYEGFKKSYMKKIDLKDFKKIKKGSMVMYMGGEAEVVDNNGYVLTLKKDGKKFTVNKSMFDHGGMIREGVMDNIHLMADASKDYDDFKKKFKKGFPKIFKSTPDFMDWLYGMYKDMAPDKVEEGKAPDADKAMRDLERKGSQIDWLDDADDDTKKIWKKAGVNPDDENTVILYSYVSHQWDDAKKILKKYNVDFKELEDPNSAGESFIVFVKESLNEKVIKGKDAGNFVKMAKPGRTLKIDDDIYTALGKGKWKGPDGEKLNWIEVSSMASALGNKEVVYEAAYVPSNIEEFAKRRGVLRDVKQIARWAEKAGKRIVGGTAIGKGYDTLVLDLRHHGGEIYYDTDRGTIKVNGMPVDSWKTFSKAVNESSEKDGTEASDGKYKHDDHLEEDIEAMWKKAYGEKFASKYPGVAKIIRQRKITDKREIARIWQETYGENFKEEYPAMWDMMSK